MTVRLDKYLTDMQAGTRSQAKEMIRRGRITVNGSACKKPETKVAPETDVVCLDGQRLRYVRFEYYMLNKPAGVITASTDAREKTVSDLIASARKDLFPVGRLDRDTEGLLLITNDGELTHHLLSPKRKVSKTYEAILKGIPGPEAVKAFREGLSLEAVRNGTGTEEGFICKPAELVILDFDTERDESVVRITVTEGKYHQVKRMAAAVGCEVRYLRRIAMGPLRLDEKLKPGEYRELTAEELAAVCDMEEVN
ncbi:MAG: rRNA pseudouridine synthase [Lachnospiraceae bacterium]|nr:rRNA pseudouridine synthase [Lachnospiraceae bacterium]